MASWFSKLLMGGASSPAISQPARRDPVFASSAVGISQFTGLDDPRLHEYLRTGSMSSTGEVINEAAAMSIAVSNRCVNLITGIVAMLPHDLMIRVDEVRREPAVRDPFRDVLTVKPNRWQTPAEFRRMLTAHKLLHGDGFALKVKSAAGVTKELIPLHPSRVEVVQLEDLSLRYLYRTNSGSVSTFNQNEIFHMRGLTLDGIRGMSVISYARETMGLSRAAERAGANLFRRGSFVSGYLKAPGALSDQAYNRLLDDINASAGVNSEAAGRVKILEEGLTFDAGGISAKDAEWIQARGFTRTDVGMFYGVPPHLYGDSTGSTSWGSGLEQQNIAFNTYTIGVHNQAWVETYKRDCLSEKGMDKRLYVHIDMRGFLRADTAARTAYYQAALGNGNSKPWMTQNEVRASEDLPPRSEAWADELAPVGMASGSDPKKENAQ